MKQRGWLIVGFVAVFLLGAVAGGAAVAGSHARHQAALLGPPGRGSYAALLNRRLKLRPDQRGVVEGIVSKFEADRERIMTPVEPALRARRTAMRAEVRATLDAEQATDFDSVNRELDENRSHRGHGGSSANAPPAASEAPQELGASNR
ncbi:MAG TPA: hypothetical protein VMI54_11910 [Polyangiaceae bacterium]|nr:hypothetical protein [Polyangiaceae bacterium]